MRKKGVALAALIAAYSPVFAQENLVEQPDFYKFMDPMTGEFVYQEIEREPRRMIIINQHELPPCEESFCDRAQMYIDEVKRREEFAAYDPFNRLDLEFRDRNHNIVDTIREIGRFAIPLGAYALDTEVKPSKSELVEFEVVKK